MGVTQIACFARPQFFQDEAATFEKYCVNLIILDQEAILDFQLGPDLKNVNFLAHFILYLNNLLF